MFRLNVVCNGFSVKIMSGTDKECKVRFPTDAEWCERVRKVKVLRTPLGRDKFQSEATGQEEADAALFNKIRLDGDSGVEFDPAECSKVISKLDSCRVEKSERDGENFKVWLEVPGGEVGEVMLSLHMPTLKQTRKYERGSMSLISGKRSQEWRSSMEPAGELFDALYQGHEGYAGTVPITHKYTAVQELLDQCEEAVGDGISIPEE